MEEVECVYGGSEKNITLPLKYKGGHFIELYRCKKHSTHI